MTGFYHYALQQAVYATLSNHTELMAHITGVFDAVPQNAVMPYVVIHQLKATTGLSINSDTQNWRVSLRIYSQGGGQKETAIIMQSVYAALHRAAIATADCTILSMEWLQSDVERRDDGVTYEGKMEFSAFCRA